MANSGSGEAKRKKPIVLSLGEKLEILNMLKDGGSNTAVGRVFGLNESTVRSIKSQERQIRRRTAKRASNKYTRDVLLKKTEQALALWIELNCKTVPMVNKLLRDKAVQFYTSFKSRSNSKPKTLFKFSTSWLDLFKMRYDVKVSTNCESSTPHVSEIQSFIEEQGYTTDQIFSADQTVLFWKKLPERSFLAKIDEKFGYEIENRVSVMLCTNASGDYVLKPVVVHKKTNSAPFKNVNELPVIWTSANRPWMTSAMFVEWFRDHFIPNAKIYLRERQLKSKILLLIDETPGRVRMLNTIDPDVTVMNLPSSSSVFTHPMKEIITLFKVCYMRNLFERIMDAVTHQLEASISIWLKNFSMVPGLVHKAAKDMGKSSIAACWRGILPEADYKASNVPKLEERIEQIVNLARQAGGEWLSDMTSREIRDVIFFDSVGLTDSDIIDVVEESIENEYSVEEEPTKKQKQSKPKRTKRPKATNRKKPMWEGKLKVDESPDDNSFPEPQSNEPTETSLKWVNELLHAKDILSRLAATCDPNEDRYMAFQRALEAAARPYEELRRNFI